MVGMKATNASALFHQTADTLPILNLIKHPCS